MNRVGIAIMAFGFSFILAVAGTFLARPFVDDLSYPTDEQLEQTFKDKRIRFDAIIEQFQEEPRVFIVDRESNSWSENGDRAPMNSLRRLSFQQLMQEIGAVEIRRGHDGKSVSLLVWSSPGLILGIGGRTKHYVWHPEYDHMPVVSSLDDLHKGSGDAAGYKRLGDGWYLYYDRW